jgi:ribosomal protein S18 acetylase RimI-like enzyme
VVDESAAHRAARLAPRGAHRLRPDGRIVERPGWYQVITPSDTVGWSNEVLYGDLPEGEEDTVLDEVCGGYAALGVPFKWCVWPWSVPSDLGDRLSARGLQGRWARGMTLDTATEVAGGEAAVEAVDGDVDAFAEVWSEGWGEPLDSARVDARRMADDPRQHLFVACCEGEPAGVATYLDQPGGGYLLGAVVLPAFRGRGLYRALIAARLRHLRQRGVQLATTHTREATSAPILERLGFETQFRYRVFFADSRSG